MSLKVYGYKRCGTCKKALKFLNAQGIAYTEKPIRETPPSKAELNTMLRYLGGDIRKLFSTSGNDYKVLRLKDKLPTMSRQEAIELLASNGNLVRRPFVLGQKTGAVGFREDEWREKFL